VRLHLTDQDATLALGAVLGQALARTRTAAGGLVALALSGPLGAGKTTLVRGLVAALPGAEAAEVSSPSFNIVNMYPTRPQVAHFDLYRVAGAAPEEYLDALDTQNVLVVAEWLDNLPRADWPEEALTLTWASVPSGRTLEIRAWGKAASALLEDLAPQLNTWEKDS
jgi:tRNA threonylcarbamoyladenosine biosynthesis protein TsaE